MPSACLSAFLPNSPPIFSLCCSCCGRPSFHTRSSKLRTSLISESRKGSISLLQSIAFFHGQTPSKSLQVLAFNRNIKILSKRELELPDEFEEDSRFPQIEEARNSRVFEDADEIQELSAINREIEVKNNVALFGFPNSEEASRSDSEEVDIYPHSGTLDFGVASDVNIVGGIPQKEQDTGNLHPKDRIFMDLGRRRRKFDVHDLVKKIISLPDEERAKVLDLFNLEDTQMTVSDYNDILMALVRAGEYESAEILFSEILSRGLSPDSWTLSTMIQCFCKKNDPDKANEVLDVMLQKGLHPDVYTFTGLISCLGKRGRLNKIYEVFGIMDRVGCQPTIRNYNSLIYGLCYVGKVEEALQLLDTIKKFIKGPDIYSFTFVMDGFCKVGRTDEAKKLLKEALKLGLTPTNATYNCLFNGYCKECRPLEALHLLNEKEGENFKPDIISYNTLLQGLLKCREIHAALRTYKKMRRAGFQADDRSMNTLIRGLCRQSMISGEHLEEAKDLFDEITCKGFGPSPYTYCLMVQALAENGDIDTAMSYLTEMIEDRHSPRIMTYNVVLRILCGKGRADDALGVLIIMIKRDTMPSKFSLSILIDEFNRQGRLLDSSAVYSVAMKRAVVPHRKPRRDWIYENKLFYSLH